MSDVECPYCKHGQEINHDDGYGYEDGRDYEQSCTSCCETFKFTTSISFDYEVGCMSEHEMEQNDPPFADLWDCKRCDYYEVKS